MRPNLTKKEIINAVYMQVGYSKKLIETPSNLHKRPPKKSNSDIRY